MIHQKPSISSIASDDDATFSLIDIAYAFVGTGDYGGTCRCVLFDTTIGITQNKMLFENNLESVTYTDNQDHDFHLHTFVTRGRFACAWKYDETLDEDSNH